MAYGALRSAMRLCTPCTPVRNRRIDGYAGRLQLADLVVIPGTTPGDR